MRTYVLLLALLLAGTAGAAAPDEDALVFVRASYRDAAQLQRIGERFQHAIVDRAARTVQVEATADDIRFLRRAGFRVEIDRAATARMREAERALASGVGIASIPGYACYRTVEETYATMDALAAAHPNLARVIDIGPSWLRTRDAAQGYRMRVLRLTNAATNATFTDKPNMVVFASVHAREYTPAELLTRFGEWLVLNYGTDSEATWLLDSFRFHLVLQGNPDGRKKAEAGQSWRKNVNTSYGACSASAYGVDLNRNFPYRWNSASGGSSGNPCASTYRGPLPGSEPETANLMRYVAGTPDASGVHRGGVLPDRRGDAVGAAAPADYRGLFVDLHSYSRLVLWPWSHTTAPTANATALRTLGRRLAYFNGYSPRQWTGLYVADGTNTDAMYGALGAPSYTIELGVAFFESCSTFEGTTLPRNLAALRYAARNLRAPYGYPAGPDTTAIAIAPARVDAGQPVTAGATLDDGVFNQSNGTEPVQAIVAAQAFLDQRPWTAGATARAMTADDGAFDATRERASVVVPTAGLAPGRHAVFVRGIDASGRAGTPDAVHFTVAGSRSFANGTDLAVPDRGSATSTLAVAGLSGAAPSALAVNVEIRHPDRSALRVELIAPGGTVWRLHDRGGSGPDLVAAYLRDASRESANGAWRLRVTDQAAGNAGHLAHWSLRFDY